MIMTLLTSGSSDLATFRLSIVPFTAGSRKVMFEETLPNAKGRAAWDPGIERRVGVFKRVLECTRGGNARHDAERESRGGVWEGGAHLASFCFGADGGVDAG